MLANQWLSRRLTRARARLPRLEFWPEGRKCAVVLTHDVELQGGFDRIRQILDIEEELGFRSSWNLVPERYRIDPSVVHGLWDRGHEVGVHGLKHDGRLFSSRRVFEARLVSIHRHAKNWGAKGFRSPSTYRNAAWMQAMEFEYDTSFYDSDPFEPQAGGCCHVFPFKMGRLIELPYTLPQDHTLFEVLRVDPLSVWLPKAEWVRSVGGMVLVITHPDYLHTSERLAKYRKLLEFLRGWDDAWFALPLEAARWWRTRLASQAEVGDDGEARALSSDSRVRASLVEPPSSEIGESGDDVSCDESIIVETQDAAAWQS